MGMIFTRLPITYTIGVGGKELAWNGEIFLQIQEIETI
jgi:hypothetical protein